MSQGYSYTCKQCRKTSKTFSEKWQAQRRVGYCSYECAYKAHTIPAEERFWKFVEKTSSCWLWKGASARGYGKFGIERGSKVIHAHRFSYELAKGKIPEGLTIDHLCRNTLCVNPDHLEAVTLQENLKRGIEARSHKCDSFCLCETKLSIPEPRANSLRSQGE